LLRSRILTLVLLLKLPMLSNDILGPDRTLTTSKLIVAVSAQAVRLIPPSQNSKNAIGSTTVFQHLNICKGFKIFVLSSTEKAHFMLILKFRHYLI